jgi:uncharacterized membrane protein
METKQHHSKETLETWHNDPSNWKWGFIYYNKQDDRLFPPKRTKVLGWTVNFAKPKSIIAMVGLFVVVLILMKYLKSL